MRLIDLQVLRRLERLVEDVQQRVALAEEGPHRLDRIGLVELLEVDLEAGDL